MAFFEELGKKAQAVAGVAAEKAKDLAGVASEKAKSVSDSAKASMEIISEQREMEKNYRAIGEWFVSEYEGEIPDAMINNRVDDLVRDWEYRNRYQGITVADYLKFTNTTIEQFKENFKEPAAKQVKLRLAL